jgi:hypothetical protein
MLLSVSAPLHAWHAITIAPKAHDRPRVKPGSAPWLPAQQVHQGRLQLIQRPGLGHDHQLRPAPGARPAGPDQPPDQSPPPAPRASPAGPRPARPVRHRTRQRMPEPDRRNPPAPLLSPAAPPQTGRPAARQLGLGQSPRQLQQRQRVPCASATISSRTASSGPASTRSSSARACTTTVRAYAFFQAARLKGSSQLALNPPGHALLSMRSRRSPPARMPCPFRRRHGRSSAAPGPAAIAIGSFRMVTRSVVWGVWGCYCAAPAWSRQQLQNASKP